MEIIKKKYIKEADLYIDNCNMNYYFTYVYDNQCYEKCPNGTYIHKDNNYLSINNYNDSLEYKNRKDEINKDETDEANTECDPLSYFVNLCIQKKFNKIKILIYIKQIIIIILIIIVIKL